MIYKDIQILRKYACPCSLFPVFFPFILRVWYVTPFWLLVGRVRGCEQEYIAPAHSTVAKREHPGDSRLERSSLR